MKLNLKKKLGSFFTDKKRKPFVELAYLFGSRAQESKGPMSDYDIAALFTETPSPESVYEMSHDLGAHINTDRLDLVVLNRAPIELRYAIIATGIVIYEINKFVRVEYEALTLSRYGDYLPTLRAQRRELLEGESKNEAGIQRYRKALGETQRLLKEIRTV